MKFIDFIGNEKIKQQLIYLAEAGRLPHAIVIEGDEGLGKRTLARELALNLFCRSDEETPCRKCAQCSKVMKQIHPDIFEYSAAGGPRSFHVDVIRDVRRDAFMQPNEANYRIFILGNCQCMSENAQNALLKVLEEPPSYAVFILTVTNKSALLETVLSRSVVITLEGVEGSMAAEYICSKDEGIEYADALKAVEVWGGNIGKAIQSLSDGKLSKISDISNNIALALLSENEYDLLKACSVFERDRETMISALSLLKTIIRDALLYGSSSALSGSEDTARILSSRLSRDKLLKLYEAADNLKALAEKNGNNSILITKICYDLRKAQGR